MKKKWKPKHIRHTMFLFLSLSISLFLSLSLSLFLSLSLSVFYHHQGISNGQVRVGRWVLNERVVLGVGFDKVQNEFFGKQ